MDENNPADLKFEAKIHSAQFPKHTGNSIVPIWRSVKHQESSGTGPEQLAA